MYLLSMDFSLILCGVSNLHQFIDKADTILLYLIADSAMTIVLGVHVHVYIIITATSWFTFCLHAFCILKGYPHFQRSVPHTTFQVWIQIYR